MSSGLIPPAMELPLSHSSDIKVEHVEMVAITDRGGMIDVGDPNNDMVLFMLSYVAVGVSSTLNHTYVLLLKRGFAPSAYHKFSNQIVTDTKYWWEVSSADRLIGSPPELTVSRRLITPCSVFYRCGLIPSVSIVVDAIKSFV